MSVDLEFRIPIVRAIPDSLNWIPDSEAQDSRFYKQKFIWFRHPDCPTSRDTKRRPRIQLSLNFSLALLPKNVDLTMTWVNFKVFNYLRGYINSQKFFIRYADTGLKVSGNLNSFRCQDIVWPDSVTPNLAPCSIYCIQNSATGFKWS